MGTSQSIPASLTHTKLFELTKDTRYIMSILLEYMLKEITVRDFLALSNPSECKKYVVFMANNLYKYFYELQIIPTKDKKGVIAFRSSKDLTNPPEDTEKEKQSLCLILSYYYVRIFQIYGALSLTLIDDISFMTDSGIMSTFSDDKKTLYPPGYKPYHTFGGGLYGGISPTPSLGNFIFLHKYLTDDIDPQKGYLTKYDTTKALVYFNKEKEERDELGKIITPNTVSPIKLHKGSLSIAYKGAKKYSYIELSAKKDSFNPSYITLMFGKLKYYKKNQNDSTTIDLPISILPSNNIIIQSEIASNTQNTVYRTKNTNLSITDFLNNFLNKVVPYIKQLSDDDEKINKELKTSTEEAGSIEELRLGRIIQNLTKTKPLGHCIARALQLLKTIPLKDEPGISYICKAKFFEATHTTTTGTKTTTTRSGIPEPGSYLDTSPGLASLAQLFYDTIAVGSPKLIIGTKPGPNGESSLQQYIKFMRNIATLFGDNKDTTQPSIKRSDESLIQSGLKGIKNRRDKDLCKDLPSDITISSNIARNVYQIVNNLFKLQLNHAIECGKIFKLLFEIQRDKETGRFKISLSDNIIKKGFPEIERINYIARELLINYYTNCETKYVLGMKMVIDSKKTQTNTTSKPITISNKPIVEPTKPMPLATPGTTLTSPTVRKKPKIAD